MSLSVLKHRSLRGAVERVRLCLRGADPLSIGTVSCNENIWRFTTPQMLPIVCFANKAKLFDCIRQHKSLLCTDQ